MAQPVSADRGNEQHQWRQPQKIAPKRIQSLVNLPRRCAQLHKKSPAMSIDYRIEKPEALALHLPVLKPSLLTLGPQVAFRDGLQRVLSQKIGEVDGLALRGKDLQILLGVVLGIGFRDFFAELGG